jgi:hypothetical protein
MGDGVDIGDLVGHAGRQHEYVVIGLEHAAGDPAGVAWVAVELVGLRAYDALHRELGVTRSRSRPRTRSRGGAAGHRTTALLLLALGAQTVGEQGQVDVVVAAGLRGGLHVLELVLEDAQGVNSSRPIRAEVPSSTDPAVANRIGATDVCRFRDSSLATI